MARSCLRATGLTKPARRLFGPMVGRAVFRTYGNDRSPVEVLGHKMFLAAPDRYPPLAMAAGRYEPETTNLMVRVLGEGMSAIDVGAHVGYFALLAARAVGPTGKIYAFEPEPVNYGLLLENARMNGYENIEAVNKGVSDRTGPSTLYITGLDTGRNSLYLHDLPQAGTITVDTVTVDEFLEARNWPSIDLVKVDVEGSEALVWAGMSLFRQKTTKLNLILEFNPVLLKNAGVDPLQFLSMPGECGFKVSWIDEETGLQSIESVDTQKMISRLEAREISVNLFCNKG